jgi:hypothetical protein
MLSMRWFICNFVTNPSSSSSGYFLPSPEKSNWVKKVHTAMGFFFFMSLRQGKLARSAVFM